MSKNKHIFYFKTPETKSKKKTIKWKAPLKHVRCESETNSGSQCSRKTDIGAGLCAWHLSSQHNLCIKKSTIKIKNKSIGLDLFTISPKNPQKKRELIFRKHDRVLEYKGEIINKTELVRRYGDCTAPYAIGGRDKKGHYFCPHNDAALQRCTASLINHGTGKHANTVFVYNSKTKLVEIEATKNIYTDEELLCDYFNKYTFVGELTAHFATKKKSQSAPKWFKFGEENKYALVLYDLCDTCTELFG